MKEKIYCSNCDTYVKSLTNEDTTNSNIDLNGYKLYVQGTELAK